MKRLLPNDLENADEYQHALKRGNKTSFKHFYHSCKTCAQPVFSCRNNFSLTFPVNLVERNAAPNGYQLLNTRSVGRHDASDIIALAAEIQNADASLRNTSTGKLSLILDQVMTPEGLRLGTLPLKYLFVFFSTDSIPSIASAENSRRHENRPRPSCCCVQFSKSAGKNLPFV